MQREDVIQLAREVGLSVGIRLTNGVSPTPCITVEVERFAAAVEQRTLERAAQVADEAAKYNRHISIEIAAAIRALKDGT